MLILTRKPDEAIMIGDEIQVRIVAIKGNQIRLGISAPNDVVVHRKEVYERIQNENLQAQRKEPDNESVE